MLRNIHIRIFPIFFLLLTGVSGMGQKQNVRFSSPVHFPIYLSSNFGEIRPDHFHSGIDIKTNGRAGEKIYAIEDGFISRIKVAVSGFGKAVYVTHPNGYTSVYCHLSRFTDEETAYVMQQQYRHKSYTMDLSLPAGLFRVKKGQLIGFSGNTGNSFGPHLHFEIRETRKEAPVNPLLFSFPVKDTIAPRIYRLYLYPESPLTLINNRHGRNIIRTRPAGARRYVIPDTLVHVTGPFSLGLEAQDYMNGSHNRCGIYSFRMLLDRQDFFYYTMDEFTYNESRYINSYIDYREKVKNNRNVIRTLILPNNRLDIYRKVRDKGIVSLSGDGIHRIDFILSDIHGNTSRFHFYVVKTERSVTLKATPPPGNYLSRMYWDRDNYYAFDGFRIYIPKGALYDTLDYTMKIASPLPRSYAPVYIVHSPYVPLQKACTIRITPDSFPAGKADKLLIAEVSNSARPKARGGQWNGKEVTGKVIHFGKYTLLIDTLPPTIHPLFPSGKTDLSAYDHISFIIRDKLSGISSYNGYIDGKWALFEYEPKKDRLRYYFDKERVPAGKMHQVKLVVTDERGNEAVYEKELYW